jgi:4-amino-4-deoxy-L-arabinose transferase-like glycosyltransferase
MLRAVETERPMPVRRDRDAATVWAMPPPGAPSRTEWLALAVVLMLALALRLLHWQQLRAHDPFFALPSVDERMYHEWAKAIVAGDGLGDAVFLNGPLYPYFLAGVYALFGPSLAVVKAVQCVLGAAACGLLWALARRLFDVRVALLAATGLAIDGMAIFYAGALLVANLQLLLAIAILLAVVDAIRAPRARRWLAAGACVGLSAIARPNVLLFAALLLAWIPFALRALPATRRLYLSVTFAAGVTLLVLPVTLHNVLVGKDFVLVSHAGGLNLFLGNNPDANGAFRVPRIFPRSAADDPWEQRALFESYAERASGHALTPSQVSDFWRDAALEYVRTQPAAWLRLELRKLALAVNAFEAWNIRSYTLTRDSSRVLHLPLLSFGALAPLAMLGLALSARQWRRLFPLYAMLLTVLATLLIFFVLARYRMPAVPVLLIFAAAALVAIADALRAGRWRRVALCTLTLAAAAVLVHRPLLREDLSMAYYNLGNRYRELEQWPAAIGAYRESLRRGPGYISAENNLAIVYERSGQDAEAARAWQRVRALAETKGLPQYIERADRHLSALRGAAPPPEAQTTP